MRPASFSAAVSALFILAFLQIGPSLARAAESLEPVELEIRRLIDQPAAATGSERADGQLAAVRAFYETRNFKPIWSRDSGPKGKAKALVGEIRTAAVHGLKPEFYNIDRISVLMGSNTARERAELELLLSGALVDFSNDLANGRVNVDAIRAGKAVKPVALEAARLIEGAADAGNLRDFAGKLLTNDKRYMRLVAKMAEFSRLAARKSLPTIAPDGAALKAGDNDPRLADIRSILAIYGDLPIDEMNGSVQFDEALRLAVERFQRRNGLAVTGKIDGEELRILSLSASDIVTRIAINLERRRWQNRPLGKRYFFINLANRELKVVDDTVTVGVFAITGPEGIEKMPVHYAKARPAGEATGQKGVTLFSLSGDAARSTHEGEAVLQVVDTEGKLRDFLAEESSADGIDTFVTYLTAWADGKGRLSLRNDVAGRDAAVARALDLAR